MQEDKITRTNEALNHQFVDPESFNAEFLHFDQVVEHSRLQKSLNDTVDSQEFHLGSKGTEDSSDSGFHDVREHAESKNQNSFFSFSNCWWDVWESAKKLIIEEVTNYHEEEDHEGSHNSEALISESGHSWVVLTKFSTHHTSSSLRHSLSHRKEQILNTSENNLSRLSFNWDVTSYNNDEGGWPEVNTIHDSSWKAKIKYIS